MLPTSAHRSWNLRVKAILLPSLSIPFRSLAMFALTTASSWWLPATGWAQEPPQIANARDDRKGQGERTRIEQQAQRDIEGVLAAAGIKPREVMLLGTFHFKDAARRS